MKVLVGCPVYQRGWILHQWFTHLKAPGVDISWVFVYTPSDDGTLQIIERHTADADVEIIEVTAGDHSIERNWSRESRIATMVELRNRLLEYAARKGLPYFSLDSDILVPINWPFLVENLQEKDAVAPLAYLAEGPVSNAFISVKPNRRAPIYNTLQPVVAICAAKMMSYRIVADPQVRYSLDPLGEDFAWSKAARTARYNLGFNSSIKCKHIMKPAQLSKIDQRIGW